MPQRTSTRTRRQSGAKKAQTENKARVQPRSGSSPAIDAEDPTVFIDDETIEAIRQDSEKILFSVPESTENSLSLYLAELRKYDILSKEEEQEWAKRAAAGDQEAKEMLIRHNLRFVVSVAKKYEGRGVPLEDLIAEGNQGLLKAVMRFNPDRGTRFISYAVHWILQSILTALANQQRPFRIPPNRAAQLAHIHRVMQKISEKHGRTATATEIAKETSIPAHMVEALLQVRQAEMSLDSTEPADGRSDKGVALAERIAAEEGTEEQLDRRFLTHATNKALDRLRPRDQKILRLYYGLDGGREHTLEEIGFLLNITRERVRQLRDRALRELRQQMIMQELKEHYL